MLKTIANMSQNTIDLFMSINFTSKDKIILLSTVL